MTETEINLMKHTLRWLTTFRGRNEVFHKPLLLINLSWPFLAMLNFWACTLN